MVALSKLINNGLLLAGQEVFSDVATPQQASVEQFNILRYLGGLAPFIQNPGFGIPSEIPDQCTVEQVQLYSRHGERYPSKKDGRQFSAIWTKLQENQGNYKGPLAFLNDYTYFVSDSDYYEKETTPVNSEGFYSGTTDALRHGATFRAKYNSLYSSNQTLPVFTSNSGRVAMTSRYFARGFLGDDYSDQTVHEVIIDEDESMGANSLTPSAACETYDEDQNLDYVDDYPIDYVQDAIDRWEEDNPSLNLTTTEARALFRWCAFEINVRGSSPFCDLFTNEEYIKYGYYEDLSAYYSTGPGNNMSLIISAPLWNASLTLLKDTSATNKVWLSFSHDDDLERFYSARLPQLDYSDMPNDRVPFPIPYQHTGIVPQGARIIIEKFSCSNESYVRFVLNDAVQPIPSCSTGPGFSCKLEDYEDYVESILDGKDYALQCNATDVQDYVSFYWDYKENSYNASFIDS